MTIDTLSVETIASTPPPDDPLVLFVDRRTWELHVRPRSRIPRDAFLVLTDPFVKETPSDAPDL